MEETMTIDQILDKADRIGIMSFVVNVDNFMDAMEDLGRFGYRWIDGQVPCDFRPEDSQFTDDCITVDLYFDAKTISYLPGCRSFTHYKGIFDKLSR